MAKCFIFGALPVKELPYRPEKGDLIIAADKGLEVVLQLEIKPDIIIGDFDSLGFVPVGESVIKLPAAKDDTDIGYAIKYASELGYNDFVVYGGIGGLLDHSFANIELCSYISKRGGRSVFVGEDTFVTAITDGDIILENKSGRISVFSADSVSSGVDMTGLKYNLHNCCLTSDFPLGVSNEFTCAKAHISVKSGTLIIITKSKI